MRHRLRFLHFSLTVLSQGKLQMLNKNAAKKVQIVNFQRFQCVQNLIFPSILFQFQQTNKQSENYSSEYFSSDIMETSCETKSSIPGKWSKSSESIACLDNKIRSHENRSIITLRRGRYHAGY